MPNDMRIHSSMSLSTSFKLNLLKFVHMQGERALYTNVCYKIAFARCLVAHLRICIVFVSGTDGAALQHTHLIAHLILIQLQHAQHIGI